VLGLHTISYLGDWVKKDRKDKICGKYGRGEVWKHEGKRPLGRLMHRLENNIKVFFSFTPPPKIIACEGME